MKEPISASSSPAPSPSPPVAASASSRTAGTFDLNAGFTPAGNRSLRPAENVTVRGAGPGLTRLLAMREPCRIAVAAPGVTLANLGGYGYVGVQDTADRFVCEDVYLTHSLDGRSYLDFGRKGGCTAAFMVWGRRGRTVRDLTFRRCSVERSYHHGFSLNLAGARVMDPALGIGIGSAVGFLVVGVLRRLGFRPVRGWRAGRPGSPPR